MRRNHQKSRVFTSSKEHRNRKRIILIIEGLVIFLLLVGTTLTFFGPKKFVTSEWLDSLKNRISFQDPQDKVEGVSFEDLIKEQIDGKFLQIKSVKKDKEGFFSIESTEGTKVFLVEEKDLENQVRTLQTVLSKAKIEKKKVILIDFRFDKLVVRYDR